MSSFPRGATTWSEPSLVVSGCVTWMMRLVPMLWCLCHVLMRRTGWAIAIVSRLGSRCTPAGRAAVASETILSGVSFFNGSYHAGGVRGWAVLCCGLCWDTPQPCMMYIHLSARFSSMARTTGRIGSALSWPRA